MQALLRIWLCELLKRLRAAQVGVCPFALKSWLGEATPCSAGGFWQEFRYPSAACREVFTPALPLEIPVPVCN